MKLASIKTRLTQKSICLDSQASEETVLLHLERGTVEACVSTSTNAGVTTQPQLPRCVYRTLISLLIYLCMVYCHPKANVDNMCSVLTYHIHELKKKIASLPNFRQFVNVPRRKDITLAICYCNVTGAYRVRRWPPLGSSDHCMLQLLPVYRQTFRCEKAKRI